MLLSSFATVILTVPEQVGHVGCISGFVMSTPIILGLAAPSERASCKVSAVKNPLGRSKALPGNAIPARRRMIFFIGFKDIIEIVVIQH